MTYESATDFWVHHELPRVHREFEEDTGTPDYLARQVNWVSFTTILWKRDKITTEQRRQWAPPACCFAPEQRQVA